MVCTKKWQKLWNFAADEDTLLINFDLQLFGEEKTEDASGKKLEEARAKGQVAKSADLSSVAVLFAAAYLLKFFGLNMYTNMSDYMKHILSNLSYEVSIDTVPLIFADAAYILLITILPLLLVVTIAGIIINLYQVGFLFTTESLMPSMDKLNPISGIQRLFSLQALIELPKSIIKIIIVSFFIYRFFEKHTGEMPKFVTMDLYDTIQTVASLIMDLFIQICTVFLVLGLLDFAYQKWQYMKDMKMTKTEVKQENKNTEGNPEIKGKIRQKQRAMAMQRMMQQVPEATVVVTNPTHFAVALKYEKDLPAPLVVAKGQDFMAERIKTLAREANVPIVENKPLARSLYDLVQVDDIIHPDLYKAVAELLAYVYKLNRRKTG